MLDQIEKYANTATRNYFQSASGYPSSYDIDINEVPEDSEITVEQCAARAINYTKIGTTNTSHARQMLNFIKVFGPHDTRLVDDGGNEVKAQVCIPMP